MAKEEPVILLKFKSGNTLLNSENYAHVAERRVAENGAETAFRGLTMTKLRKFYGLIMNIYTRINTPADFEKHKSDLQYLKVRMAYEAGREKSEAGREKPVKEFLEKTCLMSAIDYIATYEQFVLYCRYAESLVAYFKFYGGKES